MFRKWRFWLGVLSILLLMGMLTPASAQSIPKNTFRWVVTRYLTVNDTLTAVDIAVSDDLTVGDDLTVTDNVAADGLMLTPATLISLTNGSTLTPASSFHRIGSPGTVYVTLGVCPAGLTTVLENAINATINLTDTGTSKLTANFAMGQYDTLTLIGDGTNCYEVARANN